MAFSRRRGRPKRTTPIGKDKGTAELQRKREFGLTSEPLDLSFAKGLINEEQHNAGIRFRWLYTLKLGAPTISAYTPSDSTGQTCKYEDESWLAYRQAEYNHILEELERHRCRKITVNICILGLTPLFLSTPTANIRHPNHAAHKELNLLINGLDLIANFNKQKHRISILNHNHE